MAHIKRSIVTPFGEERMTETVENPQAFPYFHTHREGHIVGKEGMSLRDYFAGIALSTNTIHPSNPDSTENIASWCYAMADAMLKEHSK